MSFVSLAAMSVCTVIVAFFVFCYAIKLVFAGCILHGILSICDTMQQKVGYVLLIVLHWAFTSAMFALSYWLFNLVYVLL